MQLHSARPEYDQTVCVGEEPKDPEYLASERESWMPENTWLITGAPSGLGYALARHTLAQAERAAMGARTFGRMTALANRYPDPGLASETGGTAPRNRRFLGQSRRT